MKQFTWHCGASVLVDDAYATWDVTAPNVEDAWCKAMDHMLKSDVLDSGTLDMSMDLKELAIELGNIASDSDNDWEPVILLEELEECKDKKELMSTLEWIVSNNNKED